MAWDDLTPPHWGAPQPFQMVGLDALASGDTIVISGLGRHNGTYTVVPFPADDPCDEFDHERIRPACPLGEASVWYRGWEVQWDSMADFWAPGQAWTAYKGGCDLDAPSLTSNMYRAILDAVDEEEDE